jgi:HemY protein
MTRLVLFLLGVIALASGLAWLADRPGLLTITWQGYELEVGLFYAVVIFAAVIAVALLVWAILSQIWSSPAAVSHFLTRRRQRRGLDALSSGMIAIGAGDRAMATRYAVQARKSLPNEPLTHLLRAQAAQLSGDKTTARRIFEAMLSSPDTEQLGLRGLFLEAGREGEREAQRQFAERALRLNPKLSWPVEALFDLQCKAGEWSGALATLTLSKRHGHVERPVADRRRAVLLAAQAVALEEDDPDKALTFTLEAHSLAPSLIPAAAVAGRLLAARGNTPRAAKILQKTWTKSPHPELATAYAYARIGDSPRDRLDRVKQLFALNPHSIESSIAVAVAAIEAHDYVEARRILQPFMEQGLTRRVAALLARVEAEESGDKGRAREWLARAVTAPRDAAWIADGVTSDRWAPISPVTGALDAFEWRVPADEAEGGEERILGADLTEFIASGEPDAVIVKAEPVAIEREAAPPPKPAPAVSEAPVAAPPAKTPAPKAEAVDVTPEPAATKPVAQPPTDRSREHSQRTERTKIFTSPPVPDDPGPDPDDEIDPSSRAARA